MTQKLFKVRRTALIPSGDGTVKKGNAGPLRYLTRKFASLGQRFRRERIDSAVKVVEDGVKSVAPVERGSVALEQSPLDGKDEDPTTEDTPAAPGEDVQADTTDETPSQPILTPEAAGPATESTTGEAEQDEAALPPRESADERTEIPRAPTLTPAEITFKKEKHLVSHILSLFPDRRIAEWGVVSHAATTSRPSLLRHITVVTAKRVLNNQLVDMDVAELTPKMVKKIYSVFQICRNWNPLVNECGAFKVKIEFVLNEALYTRWKETRESFRKTRGKSVEERVLFHGTSPENLTP